MTAAKARRARARRGASGVWLLGLACGAGLAMAPHFLVLAGVLLAPGLFAFAADPLPGRPAARPVLLLGLAMAIRPALALWTAGTQVGTALAIAAEPRTLALAWSAQGAAWLLAEAAPALVGLLLEASARARIAVLRRARAGLEEEWGIPPLGDAAWEDAGRTADGPAEAAVRS
jgi:hypothetical protein